MGRKQINEEALPGRFPKGTLARIEAVLEDGEPRAAFLRDAVERELERREAIRPRRKATVKAKGR